MYLYNDEWRRYECEIILMEEVAAEINKGRGLFESQEGLIGFDWKAVVG